MPTFTLSVSLGEILCAVAAAVLAIILYRRCRILHHASGYNRAGVLYERDDLVAKLAVAVSLIVSRAELDSIPEDDQGAQLLNALRETCLAIVESTWLRDLERAYEDSKNRRISAYEQSTSISELRGKIEHENRRLRHEIEAIGHRLEQMLDASHGRSARASDKLSQVLDRILR
ncbi:hypothetical protein [Candidatus Thiosymbion oneisti]|uniref:hypothetical protein n=1 Tax=Candidatus Thiosymbion oneisti TaxID=589554 RepID=UPI000B7EF682|nr:hypothetical protein [Candidatus Thiosymbion oneisti]